MLRGMAMVVVCAVGAGAVATADVRAGKVVRVERRGGNGTPRFCSVNVSGDRIAAYCFGPTVNVGEKIVAVSTEHHHLVLTVAKATPYQQDCAPTTVWNVTPTVRSESEPPSGSELFVGLIDGGMDPQRSVLYMPIAGGVSGQSNTGGAVGIDRNGNGHPDIAWEQRACDGQSTASPLRDDTCFEVWEATAPDSASTSWHRLRSDVFHTCR